MTDAGKNEEAAIPREAAWPQEVVELVKAARLAFDDAKRNAALAKDYGQKGKASDAGFHATHVLYAIERARAALAPFKERQMPLDELIAALIAAARECADQNLWCSAYHILVAVEALHARKEGDANA